MWEPKEGDKVIVKIADGEPWDDIITRVEPHPRPENGRYCIWLQKYSNHPDRWVTSMWVQRRI